MSRFGAKGLVFRLRDLGSVCRVLGLTGVRVKCSGVRAASKCL